MKTQFKTYLVLSFLSTFVLFSCVNEMEFEGEVVNSKLVVNSFISSDSLVQVHVSESKFFLEDDSKYEMVNNATVNLWVNNLKIEQLRSIGNGLYTSKYLVKVGDIIKITASTSKFSEVSGTTEVLLPVQILKIDTTSSVTDSFPIQNYEYDRPQPYLGDTIGYSYYSQKTFSISFNDDATSSNYYRLVVTLRTYFNESNYMDIPFYISSNDLVFANNSQLGFFENGFDSPGGNNFYSKYHEFSDDLFNGKKYDLKFYNIESFQKYFDTNPTKKLNESDIEPKLNKQVLIVDLQSISKSYYLLMKSLSAKDSEMELFTEPVQVYTNISNGLGFIGSYSHSIRKFDLPPSQFR